MSRMVSMLLNGWCPGLVWDGVGMYYARCVIRFLGQCINVVGVVMVGRKE